LPLNIQQSQMFRIDLGNQQWHILVHAKCGGVADDRITSGREAAFGLTGNISRQAGKNNIAIERRCGRLNDKGPHRRRHLARQSPLAGFVITLSLRTIRSCQYSDFNLRVILEQLNKTLAHHTGST